MNSDSDNLPPRFPLRFLRWFCHPDLVKYIEGDLIELFEERVREKSVRKAKWLFAWDVVKLCRPGIIRPAGGYYKLNHYGMMKNNIKIAFRIFKREKFFTAINIIGLACGIWCALLTSFWIQDEVSFDKFHVKGDHIYRVLMNLNLQGDIYTDEATAYPVGDAMVEGIPEIVDRVRYSYPEPVALTINEKLTRHEVAATDPNFFQLFSVPLIQGDAKQCLQELNSVVISDHVAGSYFPGESPIGRTITVHEGDYALDFIITGVFKDFPRNSTMRFELVIPIDNLLTLYGEDMKRWGNSWFATYVLLDEGARLTEVNKKIRNMPETNAGIESFTLMLQNYEDQYLYDRFENGKVAGGRIDYVVIFSVIAFLTILIASFNYINLTTARSVKRSHEIGIRKIIGAGKGTLLSQFFTESVLLLAFAVVLGLLLAHLSLPLFNFITAKDIAISYLSIEFYALLSGIVLLTLLLAAIYPAAFLASFRATNAIKGQVSHSGAQKFLRKGIVAFQFCLTILLVSGAFVVFMQLEYLMEKDLGLDKENIIFLELDQNSATKYRAIKAALENHSGIVSVSGTNHDFIGPAIGFTSDPVWRGKSEPTSEMKLFGIQDIDYGLLEMLDVKLVKGRMFSKDIRSDSTNYIINEVAAQAMGFDDPIGEEISFWGGRGKIIGVVENFHFATLHETIKPIIIRKVPNEKFVFVKTAPGQTQEVLAHLESVHDQFSVLPVQYHFLNQTLENSYKNEMALQKLANYFSLLAIIISSLGLLGLVSYSMERRTKELAIRKVLGAKVRGLVQLLFREYGALIILSVAVGVPLSIFWMEKWLSGFAYRVDLSWFLFLVPCILLVLISGSIVGFQAFKIQRINPARSLRDE